MRRRRDNLYTARRLFHRARREHNALEQSRVKSVSFTKCSSMKLLGRHIYGLVALAAAGAVSTALGATEPGEPVSNPTYEASRFANTYWKSGESTLIFRDNGDFYTSATGGIYGYRGRWSVSAPGEATTTLRDRVTIFTVNEDGTELHEKPTSAKKEGTHGRSIVWKLINTTAFQSPSRAAPKQVKIETPDEHMRHAKEERDAEVRAAYDRFNPPGFESQKYDDYIHALKTKERAAALKGDVVSNAKEIVKPPLNAPVFYCAMPLFGAKNTFVREQVGAYKVERWVEAHYEFSSAAEMLGAYLRMLDKAKTELIPNGFKVSRETSFLYYNRTVYLSGEAGTVRIEANIREGNKLMVIIL